MDELVEMNSALEKMDGDLIQKLFKLEAGFKTLPQVDIPKTHFFANKLYARSIDIPKGSIIIGKMHKHSQINTVSKGDISVLTEGGWKRFQAPHTFESSAGLNGLDMLMRTPYGLPTAEQKKLI